MDTFQLFSLYLVFRDGHVQERSKLLRLGGFRHAAPCKARNFHVDLKAVLVRIYWKSVEILVGVLWR